VTSELRSDDPLVFDAAVVSDLTGNADDAEFAKVFVSRFRKMLPERVSRISVALDDEELAEAMDAVLSLKGSAGTVGAGELFVLGGLVEGHLKRRDFASAAKVAEDLPGAADRVHNALTVYLGAAQAGSSIR
jgi:HPt (histidine-containing phosphotransfer) domain-containing protein